MRFDLAQCNWEVRGYYPWIPMKERSMETGKTLDGVTDWLPAHVPGGVHLALYQAGLIPHPYHDQDSLCCEWVENRWWYYRTELDTTQLSGREYRLVFEGIDYAARIYVNGRELCRHVGMFDPVICNITDEVKKGGLMRIGVLIEHAPDENGQIGHTSETFTQKSRFGYHWDFGTRLVNLGIWQPCYIECQEAACLEDVHWASDVIDSVGIVTVRARVAQCDQQPRDIWVHCKLSGHSYGQAYRVRPVCGQVCATWRIEKPELWYPNGYGEQPLYQGEIDLLCQEEIWDHREHKLGIRSLEYRVNPEGPAEALPYTFVVNGCPIYVRGVNMTPLDHAYGDVTSQHYKSMVTYMRDMHVNLVRIWGGGIIESEVFYQLCDAAGILVWQEFIQSSSGLDNIPSKIPEYLQLLQTATVSAIKRRRNYTCLTAWSGGNELMKADGIPADPTDENLALLKSLVQDYDPQRLFLPTSASGPREFISDAPGMPLEQRDQCHDVHGHWNYGGNPQHYRLYRQTDSLFHSEFGCEGMCGMRSFTKWISKKNRRVEPVSSSAVYRHHGEWWCTYDRDRALFGDCRDLTSMQQRSQWIQAEGLRFIVEANRRRAGRNSGSIIWQINEPWPNVFCTNLIDYDQTPKMAYYWCKRAYAPLAVSLDYDRLDYTPGECMNMQIAVCTDGIAYKHIDQVSAQVYQLDGTLLYEQSWYTVRPNLKIPFGIHVPKSCSGMLMLRLKVQQDTQVQINEYFFGQTDTLVYHQATTLSDYHLQAREDLEESVWIVSNNGSSVALHVHAVCLNGFDLSCDDGYFSLLPGEQRRIKIQARPMFSSAFLMRTPPVDQKPRIRFIAFGQEEPVDDGIY